MRDFHWKVRVRDLKLKSLIKFRLSQNRSQSSSWSRCADAHLPSFSAGVLAHCRRYGALSEGGFPPERSCGSRDKILSLAEKAPLSSIFGKLTEKTLARVSNLFFGEDVPGVGTLTNMISQLAQLSHWRDARSPASPGPTCGNRESGWNVFTFQEKPISMIKTFNT